MEKLIAQKTMGMFYIDAVRADFLGQHRRSDEFLAQVFDLGHGQDMGGAAVPGIDRHRFGESGIAQASGMIELDKEQEVRIDPPHFLHQAFKLRSGLVHEAQLVFSGPAVPIHRHRFGKDDSRLAFRQLCIA